VGSSVRAQRSLLGYIVAQKVAALLTATKKPFMYSQEEELLRLSPNFHIHVSVSDLYIPRIDPHIFLQQNRQTDHGNIQIARRHMHVENGTIWEYLFQSFGFVSLQCSVRVS
jgi:hypothetical protein